MKWAVVSFVYVSDKEYIYNTCHILSSSFLGK